MRVMFEIGHRDTEPQRGRQIINECRGDPIIAKVEFIYGLASRYSYLASTQILRITRETGAEFRWRPIFSLTLLDRRSVNPFRTAAGGQYDWNYRRRDAEAWAAHYGVPFSDPIGRLTFEPRLPVLAAIAAGRQNRVEAMSLRLFRLIYVDERSEFGRDEVLSEARALGLDVATFAADLDSPEVEATHERSLAEAEERGVFGVPTFLYGDQLYWGNDRLVLLEAALRNAE